MNFKKILNSKKIKDSAGEPDYNWLKWEVYHWLFEQDVTEGEYNDMPADEIAELIETRIENYNNPADYGFDANRPDGSFHRNVKYLVTEIRNRGWDYIDKNY